jgi:hypothetical protein
MKAVILGEKKGKLEVVASGKTSEMQKELKAIRALSALPNGYEVVKLVVIARGLLRTLSKIKLASKAPKKAAKKAPKKEAKD